MKKMFVLLLCVGMLFLSACSKGIGEEELKQLHTGMTKSRVEEIIGGHGEMIGETNDDNYRTYTYKYQGERGGYVIIIYETDFNSYATARTVKAYENHDLK